MRISVIDEDGKTGSHRAYELGVDILFVDIMLDGAKLFGVTMADEEAGEVKLYRVGPDGKFVVDIDRQNFVTETRRGVVKVILKETAAGKWPHRLPRPAASPPPIDFTLMRF